MTWLPWLIFSLPNHWDKRTDVRTMTQQSTHPPSNTVLFARSLLFSLGMIVSTVVWAPVVLLAFPISFERRYRLSQQWTRFNIWWLEKTCRIGYRITGLEHVPKGPAIVLAKHQSTWETLFLHHLFPPQAWVVKKELLWIPFFGWALRLLEPIAIDRKSASIAIKQVLQQGKKSLDRGRWVVIFPEGTRVHPGSRGHYSAGGAMLAARSGYPIVPIAHNAGEFWQRQGFLKRPGIIKVVIGPAIDSSGRKAQQLIALTEEWIEGTMERISHA